MVEPPPEEEEEEEELESVASPEGLASAERDDALDRVLEAARGARERVLGSGREP